MFQLHCLYHRSIELRKIKRLGPPKLFKIVKPGDFTTGLIRKPLAPESFEDEPEEECLPTAQNLPPFEPLVLWRDPNDSENKIEVM